MKKILALAPTLLQAQDLDAFSHCLDFLDSDYKITWFDPLEKYQLLSFEQYRLYWKNKISLLANSYDNFIGFSLGGLLLADNLNLFSIHHRIILISTPCIVDNDLKEKLSSVVNLSASAKTSDAIKTLDTYVYGHSNTDFKPLEPLPDIAKRLAYGLGFILQHQFSPEILNCLTPVLQLVGENSALVTKQNVFQLPESKVQAIPHAGHRFLEDNPAFAQEVIKKWLSYND